MRNMDLICKDEQRRQEVRKSPLNGLDYLEVDYLEVSDDQPTLTVYFLDKAPQTIQKENVIIDGGSRITGIRVNYISVCRIEDEERDDCMMVRVDKFGDFSTYRLCLVEVDKAGKPVIETDEAGTPKVDKEGRKRYRTMTGFDPRYACLEFTFKAGCTSDLDCKAQPGCPPRKLEEPEINYLAKDYASFRQLILDRLALIMPDWQERHVPDLGITLVELLAYVGDHLSYYQDAVATEAYLDTARQRISVRRHARLVDYVLHEGCNARAWVTLWVSQDLTDEHALKTEDFYLITDPGNAATGTVHDHTELPKTLPRPYVVFEALVEDRKAQIELYEAHNEIRIYTWGDTECCLPKGATSATLIDPGEAPRPESKTPVESKSSEHEQASFDAPHQSAQIPITPSHDSGHKLKLKPCDIVIFEEIKGPKTGSAADADLSRRHAVRLTKVTNSMDPLTGQLIVEIEWAEEDALPFPVCISSVKEDDCSLIPNVSVVRGNVLLVDHGERVEDNLDHVPGHDLLPECGDECSPREVLKESGWYRPKLPRPEVTFSQPLQPCIQVSKTCTRKLTPASAMLKQDVPQALPQIKLYGIPAAPDGSVAFEPKDLIDPEPLTKDLLDESKPRARYLRGQFSKATLEFLAEYDRTKLMSVELRQSLIGELTAMRQMWEPVQDLLESGPDDRHFVVEIDNDRRSHLRFGDGESGQIPDAGMTFQAVYRVGNGPSGNVGAEAISHIAFRNNLPHGMEIRPRNPLPAMGGTAPEPIAEAKLFAPYAFRKELQRAITADDYAQIVMRDFKDKVQRAAAKLRWTGSWYEVLVAVDFLGSEEAEEELLCEITGHLYRYRRIGHDVVVKPARYVPLDIAMTVCVHPHYLRGHVKAELLDVFSSRQLPDGRKGFFHPDNLTFGEGIYLSKLIAAAQAVTGVESVIITTLERLYEGPNGEIENGILPLGPFEVARLDNDPGLPENGKLTLDIRGGR
jgi:hypothetical protein